MLKNLSQRSKVSTNNSLATMPTFVPFRGPFSRWPRLSETTLAMLVFLASVFIPSDNKSHDQEIILRTLSDVPIIMIVLLAIPSFTLIWRRSFPLSVLAVTLFTVALSTALGYSFDFFGVPIVFYSVGRYELNDRLSQFGGAAIGLISLILLFDNSETLPDIGIAFVILFISWYAGRRVRARGEYLRLLQERAEQLEREKLHEFERAVNAERVRIARELHDIVAHQVSLMTVQAGAAKTIMNSSPSKATDAMEAVETAGRQALVELRHLLGALRPDQDNSQLTPQPSLSEVPKLIESFRNAGLSVSFSENATKSSLPAGVDLAIYRIIQEALTNVVKHAGVNVSVSVILLIDQNGVNIEINDNGKGEVTQEEKTLQQPGYGILGMRERVTMLGGSLEAKPCKTKGYKVKCHIPIE